MSAFETCMVMEHSVMVKVLGLRQLAVSGLLVLMVTGCTSSYDVPLGAPGGRPEVSAGEPVQIVTTDGRRLEFTVARVDPDALVGPSERVPFDQIATLEVERPDQAKTAAAVVGGVFGIPLAILTAIGGLFVLAGPGMVMA
jgi:hypothetical protein